MSVKVNVIRIPVWYPALRISKIADVEIPQPTNECWMRVFVYFTHSSDASCLLRVIVSDVLTD